MKKRAIPSWSHTAFRGKRPNLKAYASAADPFSFIATLCVMKEEASAAESYSQPVECLHSINDTKSGISNSILY